MGYSEFSRKRYQEVAGNGKDRAEYLAALEKKVGMELTKSIEALAVEIINQLNSQGHNLSRTENEIFAFGDLRSEGEPSLVIDIMASCGVCVTDEKPEIHEFPPAEKWFFETTDRIFDKFINQGYGALTAEEKIFHDVDQLDREINNGGFEQYFSNSAGQNAHETLESLMSIGAKSSAAILAEAIGLFPGKKVPKDDEERIGMTRKVAAAQSVAVGKLDDKYYVSADNHIKLLHDRFAESIK